MSSDAVLTHDRSVQQTSLTSTIAAVRESVGTAPYCRLGADGAGWPGMLPSQPSQLPNAPLAPNELSHLCDGPRTDFPLGMLVESVKVMLNGAYLQEGLDFLLAHKQGQSKVELRRAPAAGAQLVALRVPARERARSASEESRAMKDDIPSYEALPRIVKDNLSAEQWALTRREVVPMGATIPETTRYVNLKNGLIFAYQVGERANAPLLPVFDLAGGRGKDDTQFHTAPQGAHHRV
jgi:hypothetical protein